MNTPTPKEQIHFLQQLQRILSDGSFVATYKYALLHALADLSVIHGDDSRGELTLSTRQIAEQVIELYWRQARPFTVPTREPLVLRQNTGKQAAIVNHVNAAMTRFGPSVARLRQRPDEWSRLVSRVARVVSEMPLWKLQTVGHERLEFLYENVDGGTCITLKPGVAYCFRAFHDLVLDLIRGAWLRFVRTQNTDALGEVTDLSAFLFGSGRVSLSLYRPILMEVQNGSCFYCDRSLGLCADVDHFVPWSRYPVDLGHNFVLSHAACNGSKADHLAAEPHLARWVERNALHSLIPAGRLPRRWPAPRSRRVGGDRSVGIPARRENRGPRMAGGQNTGGVVQRLAAAVPAAASVLRNRDCLLPIPGTRKDADRTRRFSGGGEAALFPAGQVTGEFLSARSTRS